jgi:solute carrier family 35 protein E1
MPHSTRPADGARDSSLHFKFPNDIKSESRTSMEPFPDHVDSVNGQFPYPPSPNTLNSFPVDRRNSRRDSSLWGSARNGQVGTGGRGHGRQQSLSDAIRTIRTRRGSVSANLGANLHDVGDALKAPLSPKLIVRKPSIYPNKTLC